MTQIFYWTFMWVKWMFIVWLPLIGIITISTKNLKDLSVFGYVYLFIGFLGVFLGGCFFIFVLFCLFGVFIHNHKIGEKYSCTCCISVVLPDCWYKEDQMVYNDEYFTLNVNEAYSFKLMCLQVPLDTKYK